MKNILVLIILAFITPSCSHRDDKSAQAKEEITDTEKAFSDMSVKEGMRKAFLYYAAYDVVKLSNRNHPTVGKDELKKILEADNDSLSVLKWYPVKADAAESGEIGYTYGNWEFTGKDSTDNEIKAYGNYFTVWKKDKDGNWKFVLDGGNTTPPPAN